MWADLIYLICILNVIQASILSLNGQWHITDSKGDLNITGDVPGGVYTALFNLSEIQDPYFRNNDVLYRWIALENWTYTRYFDVSKEDLESSYIHLIADGLDTFASIYINGLLVDSTDNMFIQHIFPIKLHLKPGVNSITINFKSAVTMSEYLYNQSSYNIPSICPPAYHGFCHYNFIRKMEYSFSWDWGPAFPSQGIWKDIYIKTFNEPFLRDISILPQQTVDGWSVDILASFAGTGEIIEGQLITILEGTALPKCTLNVSVSFFNDQVYYGIYIPEKIEIKRWWPRGYGDQQLYNVTVLFARNGDSPTEILTKQIGFRTVELVQDKVSNDPTLGNTFYFRVNGVPIFVKGANWVPPDVFLERITPDKIHVLLQSVVEANMNILTIPGLAIYETDYFYKLADEFGIMLIEGLMFCDAMYPVTQDFLDSVQKEVTQQVRRLKSHPSIIAWGFNDEDAILISQNWLKVDNINRYKKDYVTLFIDTLSPIVVAEDSTRPWIASSPSNGIKTSEHNWICENCQSELNGDVHFYDYKSDLWDLKNYPTPRMASEYGLISWCDYETLEPVLVPCDMDFFSKMAKHRTHHPNGTQQMYDEIREHFTLPDSTDTIKRFKHMIYLSQINHAMMMRLQTEHFRRSQNDFDPITGKGHTMGTIFWFLADVWQAPTWASIDFNLKWKMLHYYAKRFFSAALVSPYISNGNLSIYVINDEIPTKEYRHPVTNRLQFQPMTPSEIKTKYSKQKADKLIRKTKASMSGSISLEIYNWMSLKPMATWNIPYQLNQTSGLVFQKNLDEVLSDTNCTDKTKCFLYFYLNSKTGPTSTSWLPLSYFTSTKGTIPKAVIEIKDVTAKSSTEFNVVLATNNIAPFVWIDCKGISGRFSDNGFLMKDPLLHLTFISWQPVNLQKFKNCLSVQSLMDIYQ